MWGRNTSWTPFWKVFPPLALVPVVVLAVTTLGAISGRMEDIRKTERFAVDLQREAVSRGLNQVVADMRTLAGQNELAAYLDSGDPVWRQRMAAEYQVLARHARVYDQIRVLDDRGMEVVRVNYNAGNPAVVPDEALQDKAGRYYFTESFAVRPGEIYVSPLDLNIEHGVIELPFKPMIRVGTPVVDSRGIKRGIVLINYLAETLLERVAATGTVSVGDPMMLNAQGYWVVTPDPPPSWGFMFPEHADDRMPVLFPDAWAAMQQADSGHLRTPDGGLFTFQTYHPLQDLMAERGGGEPTAPMAAAGEEAQDGGTNADLASGLSAQDIRDYRWYLVSHVPGAVLTGIETEALMRALAIGGPLLLVLAVGTRALTVLAVERQRHQAHLETLARYDSLTGLANRATLEERLDQETDRAHRYGRRFGLLYLDLDGFKAINDALGHEMGDRVLVDVACVLENSCRSVDTPARIGGDEFVILLPELPDSAAAVRVADKILAQVATLSWGDRRVGVSIGGAIWPDHAKAPDHLMRLADEAMYTAKTSGKNRICLATPSAAAGDEQVAVDPVGQTANSDGQKDKKDTGNHRT